MGWSTQAIDRRRDDEPPMFEMTEEKLETFTLKGACTECKKPFDLKFIFKNDQPVDCEDVYYCSCSNFRIAPRRNEWSYRG